MNVLQSPWRWRKPISPKRVILYSVITNKNIISATFIMKVWELLRNYIFTDFCLNVIIIFAGTPWMENLDTHLEVPLWTQQGPSQPTVTIMLLYIPDQAAATLPQGHTRPPPCHIHITIIIVVHLLTSDHIILENCDQQLQSIEMCYLGDVVMSVTMKYRVLTCG
jgi:hypothetical protein